MKFNSIRYAVCMVMRYFRMAQSVNLLSRSALWRDGVVGVEVREIRVGRGPQGAPSQDPAVMLGCGHVG